MFIWAQPIYDYLGGVGDQSLSPTTERLSWVGSKTFAFIWGFAHLAAHCAILDEQIRCVQVWPHPVYPRNIFFGDVFIGGLPS